MQINNIEIETYLLKKKIRQNYIIYEQFTNYTQAHNLLKSNEHKLGEKKNLAYKFFFENKIGCKCIFFYFLLKNECVLRSIFFFFTIHHAFSPKIMLKFNL